MDDSPIFKPGFHDITFSGAQETLTRLLVTAFTDSRCRELLLDRLLALLKEVVDICIFTEVWMTAPL